MPDYVVVLWAIVIAHFAISVGLGILLRRFRPEWSVRRVAALSALPIPFLIWSLCAYLLVTVFTSSAEQCGVDACGMAMASAVVSAGMALGLYAVGMAMSELTIRFVRSRSG